MMDATYSFDVMGYIVGTISVGYGLLAERYKRKPKAFSRWIWIGLGVVIVAGNIAENIIEFQDR